MPRVCAHETPLLARGIVNNIEELLELIDLGGTNVVRVEVTKSERIAQFLTSPFITSIVMMCILLGPSTRRCNHPGLAWERASPAWHSLSFYSGIPSPAWLASGTWS